MTATLGGVNGRGLNPFSTSLLGHAGHLCLVPVYWGQPAWSEERSCLSKAHNYLLAPNAEAR